VDDKNSVIEITYNSCVNRRASIESGIAGVKFNSKRQTHSYRRLLESIEGYSYISLISEEKPIFAVGTSRGSVSAMEVVEFPSSRKSLYISSNLTPSLTKSLQALYASPCWAWRIESKIIIEDEEKNFLLTIIEYNLAAESLRGFIEKNRGGRKMAREEVIGVMEQLVQCLCYYQFENIAVWNISPETIIHENGRWFLLESELSEKVTLEYGQPLLKPVQQKDLPRGYLAPLVLEAFERNEALQHNPFKSDIFALGLVALELETLSILRKEQFQELLASRKLLSREFRKYCIPFREKYLIKNKKVYEIPDLLSVMLAEGEEDRWQALEIALLMDMANFIMQKVVVPFEGYFKAEETKLSNKCKVSYTHSQHEYEGLLKSHRELSLPAIREGQGVMNFEFKKSYSGNWENNLPHGRGNIFFSESWKYDGSLRAGKLHDEGTLAFNGSRVIETVWFNNLPEKKLERAELDPQPGYYLFAPHEEAEYKMVLYYKLHHCSRWVINLCGLDFRAHIQHVSMLILRRRVSAVHLLERQDNYLFSLEPFEAVALSSAEEEVLVMVAPGQAKQLLLRLLETEPLQRQPLTLQFGHSSLLEDELQAILKKRIRVESIHLQHCKNLSDKAVRVLCNSLAVMELTRLDLTGLAITDKSLN
jgi:hypothetical protein